MTADLLKDRRSPRGFGQEMLELISESPPIFRPGKAVDTLDRRLKDAAQLHDSFL